MAKNSAQFYSGDGGLRESSDRRSAAAAAALPSTTPSLARAADAALRSVKAALQRAGEGLSDFMRRVAGVALAGPAYASSAGGMNAGAL